MSPCFCLSGTQVSQVLVFVRSLLDKTKFEQFVSAGDDTLVVFDAREASKVHDACTTLFAMLIGPQSSRWDDREINQLQEVYGILNSMMSSQSSFGISTNQTGPVQTKPALDEREISQLQVLSDILNAKVSSQCSNSLAASNLHKLGINPRVMQMKPMENRNTLAAQTSKLGDADQWSSDGLFNHFVCLENLIPTLNEAGTRSWVEPLFFRADAILRSSDLYTVLNIERAAPFSPLGVVSGYYNWVAMTTPSWSEAAGFSHYFHLQGLKDDSEASIFFVSETRQAGGRLEDQASQAICEMRGCALTMGKNIIRGAVTSGHSWIFLILKLDPAGGGIWRYSHQMYDKDWTGELSKLVLDVISGILAHWMMHSHEDLRDDDYFVAGVL